MLKQLPEPVRDLKSTFSVTPILVCVLVIVVCCQILTNNFLCWHTLFMLCLNHGKFSSDRGKEKIDIIPKHNNEGHLNELCRPFFKIYECTRCYGIDTRLNTNWKKSKGTVELTGWNEIKMNKLIYGCCNCYLLFWEMQKDIIYVIQYKNVVALIWFWLKVNNADIAMILFYHKRRV